MIEEEIQAPKPRGIGSVLIGLFAFLELLHILLANAMQPVPRTAVLARTECEFISYKDRERAPNNALERSIDGLGFLTDRWGEAVGVIQVWCMFAPIFETNSVHTVVQLLDADGKIVDEYIPSAYPADPKNYIRSPIINLRIRNLEAAITMTHNFWTPQAMVDYPEEIRRYHRERVVHVSRSMHAYMQLPFPAIHREGQSRNGVVESSRLPHAAAWQNQCGPATVH